jgi:hypothetical protein
MKIKIIFCFIITNLIFSSCFVSSKKINTPIIDTYFTQNKLYHYNTYYIDKNRDTIIRAKLIIQPLNKPWIPQRKKQESVNYIHIINQEEFNKYQDPNPKFFKVYQSKIQKKGRLKIYKIENTGGSLIDSIFYLHPPRANQYRMLYFTGHPNVNYRYLDSNSWIGNTTLKIFGFGNVLSTINISPIIKKNAKLNDSIINYWQINTKNEIKFPNENNLNIYNSKCNAVFCKEIGFIEMLYTFENGIKIDFYFDKITIK